MARLLLCLACLLLLPVSGLRAFEGYVFDAMVSLTAEQCQQLGPRCARDAQGNPVMLRMRPDPGSGIADSAAARREAALKVPAGYVLSSYVPVSQELCQALPYQCLEHQGSFLIPGWTATPTAQAQPPQAQQPPAVDTEAAAAQVLCDTVTGGGLEGFLAEGGLVAQEVVRDALSTLEAAATGPIRADSRTGSINRQQVQDLQGYTEGLRRRGLNRLCR